MDKQIQEALGRIDQVVAQVNMPRKAHAQLAQDLQLINQRLIAGAEAQKELKYISEAKKADKK